MMSSKAMLRSLASAALASLALVRFCPDAHAVCPSVSFQPATTYPVPSGPQEVVSADFTGDTIPDLAVTGRLAPSGAGLISVFPGLKTSGVANGTFGERIDTPVGSEPLGLATADLNADGRPDLIVCNGSGNAVRVLLGVGAGQFTLLPAYAAGSRPYEVLARDFNGDGVLDLAVADNGEFSVRVLLGGSDGAGHWNLTFGPAVAYATASYSLSVAAGDFNGDGITDLVATESFAQTLAVFLGNSDAGVGDGTFRPAMHIPCGPEPYDIATGSFNGDNKLDLAVSVSGTGGLRVLLGSGVGTFPVNTLYLAGINSGGASVADLDGDGIQDIVTTGSVANNVYLLLGQGASGVGDGTFAPLSALASCCFPVHVLTADLDQNGRQDLVTCDNTSNEVGVFLDGCSPDLRMPRIARIRDVPNDQGGKVFITWARSSLDVLAGAVNAYRVWRMVPLGLAASHERPAGSIVRTERVQRPNGTTDIVYWEALATLPAQRLAGYGYAAATTQDSLPGSNPLFTYRISALTSDIDVYFDSDPDSGYSVDNLAPALPAQFLVHRSSGANLLQWAASPEADFAIYRLYRSSNPEFTPSPATLLATLTTPGFVDPGDAFGSYKLEAVDLHGNVSPAAAASAPANVGSPERLAGATWLAAPTPNPMRRGLDVRLALGRASDVSLALYDQQGRRTRVLLAGARPAGELALRWDGLDDAGRPANAGLYFLELRSAGERFVRRVVRLR